MFQTGLRCIGRCVGQLPTFFFLATARAKRFPRMPFLHFARSSVSIRLRFNFAMSSSTHCHQVFLGLPLPFTLSTTMLLHADTQSSESLRSKCPSHLNLPRLTTAETLSIPSRLNSSTFAFLSLNFTPHIYLIIICSLPSSVCISSASLPTSRCHTPARSVHNSDKLYPSA